MPTLLNGLLSGLQQENSNIVKTISSKIRLFADDCLLYRVITSMQDSITLQKDLDTLT